VTVVHNSACGTQSTARRSSRRLTLPFLQRASKFLIANDNPTRIAILSDQRESKGLSSRSLPLEPSPSSLPWLLPLLIANLELEFRASARKQTANPKSNRKYSAISYSGARRVHPAPIPRSADGSRDARVLIGTLGISENELSGTKERRKQNPNRDKIAFSVNSAARAFSLQRSAAAHRRPIISASAPLSSAPNLAIIDFPTRGHL
jgi:ribosomal protein L28